MDKTDKRLKQDTIEKPLCIIPARGESKRLPHKNKALLNGKPLVLYAIECALASEVFDRIIVSSDDEDILEIAYENKATPHKRPKGLAGSRVSQADVCKFLLTIIPQSKQTGQTYKTFCLLNPCNPLRTPEEVNDAYNLFLEEEANYVMSVVKFEPSPQLALVETKKGWLAPQNGWESMKQSQKLKPLYRHESSFIFARSEVFLIEFEYGFYGSKVIPYFINRPSIDIDYPQGLRCAEFILRELECQQSKIL